MMAMMFHVCEYVFACVKELELLSASKQQQRQVGGVPRWLGGVLRLRGGVREGCRDARERWRDD